MNRPLALRRMIPVGLSFTAAQLRELEGITSEQEAVLSKKWFANWSAAEQLFKDMREYAVRTGRPRTK